MTEVLVLIDAVDGKVTKPSLELLTIARRIGEPSAVVFGNADNATLTEYGAEKIYTYDDPAFDEFLVGPRPRRSPSWSPRSPRPLSWSAPPPRARRSAPGWR